MTTETTRIMDEAIEAANRTILDAAARALTQEQQGAVEDLRAALSAVMDDVNDLGDLRREFLRKLTERENSLHRRAQRLEDARRTVLAECL